MFGSNQCLLCKENIPCLCSDLRAVLIGHVVTAYASRYPSQSRDPGAWRDVLHDSGGVQWRRTVRHRDL